MHLCLITVIATFLSAEVFAFPSIAFKTSSNSWLNGTTKSIHTTLHMLYVFQQKLTLTQAFITVISIKTLLKSDQWCNYVLVVSYFFAHEETNRFISVIKEGKKSMQNWWSTKIINFLFSAVRLEGHFL